MLVVMLIFLILLFRLNTAALAQSMEFFFANEVNEAGEITLELGLPAGGGDSHKNWNISYYIDKYRVRPFVSEGIVYVQNSAGKWVSGQDAWTMLPLLKQKFKVKLLGDTGYSTQLGLQLQEIKTGKILYVAPGDIYRKAKKDLYISGLNALLEASQSSESHPHAEHLQTEQNKQINRADTATWFGTMPYLDNFLRTFFVTGAVLSFAAIYGGFKAPSTV